MSILSKNTTIAGKKPLLPSNQYTTFKPNTDELGVSYKIIDEKTIDLNDSNYFEEGNYSFSGNRTSTTNAPDTIGNNQFHLTVTKSNLMSQLMPDGSMVFSVYVFQTIQYQIQTYTRYLLLMINDKLELVTFYPLTSWAKIWTESTDGSNSGLDADLLDGVQGDIYLKNNQKQSDFNSCNKPGIYALYRYGGVLNAPDVTRSCWGCITCATDGNNPSGYMAQMAFTDNSSTGPIYIRYHALGSWQPWHVLWNGTDTGNYLLTSNLLKELKKVDGIGSGLDADLLDGKHANEFLAGDSDTYYINSQSDFDSMIDLNDWGGKSNIVFNCDVDASNYYDGIYIPNNIRHIDGNNHFIGGLWNGLVGFTNPDPYNSPSISNLKISINDNTDFQGIQYINNISNCVVILNTNGTTETGFMNCNSVTNCVVKIVVTGSNLTRRRFSGFVKCTNLYDCIVEYDSDTNYPSGSDIGTDAFVSSNQLYNCKVMFSGNCETLAFVSNLGLFNSCNHLFNCFIENNKNFDTSCFVNCYVLHSCELKGNQIGNSYSYGGYGFVDCRELFNCNAGLSRGFTDCSNGLNNIYNNSYDVNIENGTSTKEIVEFMNASPTEMTEATEANIDSWIN